MIMKYKFHKHDWSSSKIALASLIMSMIIINSWSCNHDHKHARREVTIYLLIIVNEPLYRYPSKQYKKLQNLRFFVSIISLSNLLCFNCLFKHLIELYWLILWFYCWLVLCLFRDCFFSSSFLGFLILVWS